TVDGMAVAQYLQYGYVPAPLSIYEGVRKLPPAHFLLFDGVTTTLKRYWDPVGIALEPRANMSVDAAVEQLATLSSRAVRQQIVADVPLAAFLSGGVNTATIVAIMAREGKSVKTFTIGFDEPDFDESQHAADVATYLGTEHYVERLTLHDAL